MSYDTLPEPDPINAIYDACECDLCMCTEETVQECWACHDCRGKINALIESRVSERTKRLSEALANLSGKLTLIEADERYKAVWMIASLHGQKYEGPTWEAELIAVRRALESE